MLTTRNGMLPALFCAALFTGFAANAAAKKKTVAVMEFDNGSTDPSFAPLGKGLAAMVTTDLSAVGQFTVVERSRLADIKAELKLGKSKAFNKKTTAKVGKLVGASHLVTGAFTVVGDRMRIDARMIAVRTGKIVASGEVSGEKDAFFELEKGLVKQMLKGAGIKLAPKERAQLAKLHTADFKAFKKFSEGLNHFDAKNYAKAVAAMKAASNIDSDFKLASISLERYEELVSQAENKADATKTAEIEMRKLKRDKKAALEAMLVSGLAGVVKRNPGANVDRQLALHILFDMYSGSWGSTFLAALRANGDHFALQRTADTFAQAYWKYGMARPGGMPPFIGGVAYANPPKRKEQFDAFFADAKTRTVGKMGAWPKSLFAWHRFADRLYMDGKTRSRVAAKIARKSTGSVVGDCRYLRNSGKRRACVAEADSRRFKEAGDLAFRHSQYDLSTRMFMEASKRGTESRRLKSISDAVKRNRDLAQVLAKIPAAISSWVMSIVYALPYAERGLDKLIASGTLDNRLARRWINTHRWPKATGRESFMLINGTPTWLQQGDYYTWTGVRTDSHRSDAIHYRVARKPHRPTPKQDGLLIFGGTPKQDFSASFRVMRQLPKVFVASQTDREASAWADLGDSRYATTSFLFGMKDIKAKGDSSSMSARRGVTVPPRPMTGYALRMGRGQVKLVRFTQVTKTRKGMGGERVTLTPAYTDQVVKTWSTSTVDKDAFSVTVSRKGEMLNVKVGNAKWSAKLPSSQGFVGFHFKGPGYGGIRKPSLQ